MAENISVVVSLLDQMSPTLKALAGNAKAFDKTLQELEGAGREYEKTQERMVNRSTALKQGLEQANVKVAQAREEYKKLKDEASKGALDEAIEEQQKLKAELDETTAAMDANAESYRVLQDNARKTAQELGRLNQEDAGGAENSQSKTLSGTGIPKMLGDSLVQAANAGLESLLGNTAATVVSGTVSGAVSGAMAGSVLGPAGMAIGAIVGGLSGLLSGKTQEFQEKDKVFITYYNDVYQTHADRMDETVASGSELAGQRESSRLYFSNELGDDKAAAFLDEVLKTANATPFQYDELLDLSKTLLSLDHDVEKIIPTLTAAGNAGMARGFSTSEIAALATAIAEMKSDGQVDVRQLEALEAQDFPVFQWLADKLQISPEAAKKKISDGELEAGYVTTLIMEKFNAYGGLEAKGNTYEGQAAILKELLETVYAAGGDTYNALRQESMGQDIDAYGGALGKEMEVAYAAIGAGRAALENLKEAYTRDIRSAVLEGGALEQDWSLGMAEDITQLRKQYVAAIQSYRSGDDSAGLEVERIMESAEGLAQEQFEASGLYRQNLDAEKETLEALRDNTAAVSAAAEAYSRQTAATKGSAGVGIVENLAAGAENHLSKLGTKPDGSKIGSINTWGANAFGLDRVPYNDYPVRLHEGERVLTASQARQMDHSGGSARLLPPRPDRAPRNELQTLLKGAQRPASAARSQQQSRGAGGGVSVQVSVSSLVVREEADMEKIAYHLMEEAKIRKMAGEYETVT